MKFLLISPKNRTVYNFRGNLIKDIINIGYEVIVTGPDKTDIDKILALGASIREIPMNKNGTNIFKDIKYFKKLFNLMKTEKPETVLGYTIKPVVYGAIAAKMAGVKNINCMITGAGYIFTAKTFKAKVLGWIVGLLYRIGLRCADHVIFQNEDDLKEFVERRLVSKKKCHIVHGSGVDLTIFRRESFPDKINFFMLSRLLKSKGVKEYLEAAVILKKKYLDVDFTLLGKYESSMQDIIEKTYIEKLIKKGIITRYEETSDVRPFYKECSVFVLPSYREGTPRTVLEAMAMGRPIITTDTNGCRDTVDNGRNGFLVPIKDVNALVDKMESFILNPNLIKQFGEESYKICSKKYDVINVNKNMIKIMKLEKKQMVSCEEIKNQEEFISLIGLGYVGMPIAVEFAKRGVNVIGFDLNNEKIELYKSGIDPTNEVGNEVIRNSTVEFTAKEADLKRAMFHIVAVPTPVNDNHTPNLTPVKVASKILGRNLTKGSIVVFESTVYPGVTEDVCVPILETESKLKCGVDFKVGYSPERINPGDIKHRLDTITKIVSGMDEETLDTIAKVYEIVVDVGVYKAESIKVAEAAKIIENCQRDINIAFMNELSIIFNKMKIDTQSVLKAAETKWNFLKFYPGLVGGHCIGVDPYYLTYKAEELGYHSQIILSGRKINDTMGKYVAENIVKNLIKSDKVVKSTQVAIFGFTFKENCPDTRNTKVIDVVNELREYGIRPVIVDPVANDIEVNKIYGIKFVDIESIKDMDAIVLAVAHDEFSKFTIGEMDKFFGSGKKILVDIKGLLNRKDYEKAGYCYWRL